MSINFKFLLVQRNYLIKQIIINISLVYICGFLVAQGVLLAGAIGGRKMIFVWEPEIAIMGLKILTIVAIGLVIHILWKGWQDYKAIDQ